MNGESSHPWKLTKSGIAYDFKSPELVNLRDIAWALSMQCRWAGHTYRFYSVAQHCVHVSRRAYALGVGLDSRKAGVYGYNLACGGLLHDAEEAYTGDIPTPIKDMHPEIRDFCNEQRDIVGRRFRVSAVWLNHGLVKAADRQMLATEAWRFMPTPTRRFYSEKDVLDMEIPNWDQKRAYVEFLAEAERLGIE